MFDPLLISSVKSTLPVGTTLTKGVAYLAKPAVVLPQFKVKMKQWDSINNKIGHKQALVFNRDFRRQGKLTNDWWKLVTPWEGVLVPSPTVVKPPTVKQKNSALIRDYLTTLVNPITFWDVETVAPFVPRWDGFSTAKNVPFLSVSLTNNDLNCYFNDDLGDVRATFNGIKAQLGNSGSVLIYSNFELQCIKELMAILKTRNDWSDEDQVWTKTLCARLIDVYEWVKTAYSDGSPYPKLSLKTFATQLFPDHYSASQVKNGQQATDTYLENWVYNHSPNKELMRHLCTYCSLDVLIMPKLMTWLSR